MLEKETKLQKLIETIILTLLLSVIGNSIELIKSESKEQTVKCLSQQ